MVTRSRRPAAAPRRQSIGDDGSLLILLLVLWALGFVSFHSRDTGRAIERVAELRKEIVSVETRLAELTAVVSGMKFQALALDQQRDSLISQVRQLERTRDAIAISLASAERLISPSPQGRALAFAENLFTGVIGNLIATGLLAILAWFAGRRTGRREAGETNELTRDGSA